MSDLPKCIAKKSKRVFLKPGVYHYCRCGLSKDGLFCDGAHKGTDFVPKKFILDEPKEVAICLCKQTKASPHCDGTHRTL